MNSKKSCPFNGQYLLGQTKLLDNTRLLMAGMVKNCSMSVTPNPFQERYTDGNSCLRSLFHDLKTWKIQSNNKMTTAKEFIWPIRVYYEDTDSGGVVYYANYLKFMERARTEWLRSLGFEQDRLVEQEGIIFVVRRVEIDYLSPARFNDALEVRVWIVERKQVSLTFGQEITDKTDGRVICNGIIKVTSVDTTRFRPRPIPDSIMKELPDVN